MSPYNKERTELIGEIATLLMLIGFVLIVAAAFGCFPGAWIP